MKLDAAARAAAVERMRAGEALASIANDYGVTRTRLSQLARLNGLASRWSTLDQRDAAARLYAEGASAAEIRAASGLSLRQARKLARRIGLRRPREAATASLKASASRLPAKTICRVTRTASFRAHMADGTVRRLIVEDGMTRAALAASYGISIASVHALLRGLGYGHAAAVYRAAQKDASRTAAREARVTWRADRAQALRSGLAGGRSLTAIASALGISVSNASHQARRAGIAVSAGNRAPQAAAVGRDEIIRDAAAAGTPARKIAKTLGLSTSRIYQLAKRAGIALPHSYGARKVSIDADPLTGKIAISGVRVSPTDLVPALRELGLAIVPLGAAP